MMNGTGVPTGIPSVSANLPVALRVWLTLSAACHWIWHVLIDFLLVLFIAYLERFSLCIHPYNFLLNVILLLDSSYGWHSFEPG